MDEEIDIACEVKESDNQVDGSMRKREESRVMPPVSVVSQRRKPLTEVEEGETWKEQ